MVSRPLAFTTVSLEPVIFAFPRKFSISTRQFLTHGLSTAAKV